MKKNGRTQNGTVKEIPGGITAARGFSASARAAAIKVSKAPDCGLLLSSVPCSAAGAFTTNAVRASSVDWCEGNLPDSPVRAVFVNSGNANACTGRRGEMDTRKIASLVGSLAGEKPRAVLVAATGVIGHFLPMKKIQTSIPLLYKSIDGSIEGGSAFADAILTTDTRRKECAFSVESPTGRYAIGGCAKGSGMIHPSMATMLCFITTDAAIDASVLSSVVKEVVDKTFNNLTVDGDTSTNDMVLLLANGVSRAAVEGQANEDQFRDALYVVCDTLCKKIAEDGEGATKRVEIRVCGGASVGDAKLAAKAIANSNLVKTALFGNDPNWGRILCAIGYSGAAFSKEHLVLSVCKKRLFAKGRPLSFSAKEVSGKMKARVVPIDVDLGMGKECAVAHTCDLTYDYIKINAEYHT